MLSAYQVLAQNKEERKANSSFIVKQNFSVTKILEQKNIHGFIFIYFLQFINNLLYIFIYGFEQRQKKKI